MITVRLLILLSLVWGSLAQQYGYRKLSANYGGYAQPAVQQQLPPRQSVPVVQQQLPPRQSVPVVQQQDYGYNRPMEVPKQTVPTPVVQEYSYSRPTTTMPPPPPPPRQTLPPVVVQDYSYSRPTTTMPPPPPPPAPVTPKLFVPPVVQEYSYSRPTTTMPPPPPRQTLPPVVVQDYSYSRPTSTMPPVPVTPKLQVVVQNSYGYGNQMVDQSSDMRQPFQSGLPGDAPMFNNPCTEEALRSGEFQLFRDPSDRSSYLVCESVGRFHRMPCPSGTFFDEGMRQCIPEGFESNACENACKNDAECVVDESNVARCVCKAGFTGQFCETNIDECSLGGNQACGGGVCVDQINGYYCSCAGGRVGLNCRDTIENPCTPDNLERGVFMFEVPSVESNVWLQCIGESQFVVSKCAEHLFWNSELQTCTIERPLAKSGVCRTLPCKNGGECQDLGSSQFQCQCRPGFTGEVCENVIDLCLSNPCANGGRCLSWTGGYTCVCQNKIIDETCTSGLNNPCPPRSQLIPGFNDYFAHPSPNRYFHCDIDGRAFARSCMTGLRWKQEALSCLPESFVLESVVPKAIQPQKTKPKFVPNSVSPSVSTKGSFSTIIGTQGIPQLAPVSSSASSFSTSGSSYGYAQQKVEVPSFEVAIPEQVPVTEPTPVVTLASVTTQPPMQSGYGGYDQSVDGQQLESSEPQQSESEVPQSEVEPQVELDLPVDLDRVPQSGKDLINGQGKQQMFDQFSGVQQGVQQPGRFLNQNQLTGIQQDIQQGVQGKQQMFDQFSGVQQGVQQPGRILNQNQLTGIQQDIQQGVQQPGRILNQNQLTGIQQDIQQGVQGKQQMFDQFSSVQQGVQQPGRVLNQNQLTGLQQGVQQQRNVQGQFQMNPSLSQDQLRSLQQAQRIINQQNNLVLDQNSQQQQQVPATMQKMTGLNNQQGQTTSFQKQSFSQDLVNQQNTLQSQFRSFGNQPQTQQTQQSQPPRLTNSQLLRIKSRIQN